MESARAVLAMRERQRAQAEHALTVLVGEPLVLAEPTGPLEELEPLGTGSPVGLPSDLLTRRPDIRAAEQQLMAANARIGVARAAFFPRIALTTSAGSASGELLGLFKAGTAAWSFAPQLVQPLLLWGRNRAGLASARAARERAVAAYEQSIQVAFREVADALVARPALTEELDARARLREAQQARLRLARQRYEGGIATYLEVLDAERAVFDAEQEVVTARRQQLANEVALFRALGGGLESVAAAPELRAD